MNLSGKENLVKTNGINWLMSGEKKDEFHRSAVTLVNSLVAHCLETQPEAQGLLRHGTYHAHKGWGVDAYFICGDYFFLEALLARKTLRIPNPIMTSGLCSDIWRSISNL